MPYVNNKWVENDCGEPWTVYNWIGAIIVIVPCCAFLGWTIYNITMFCCAKYGFNVTVAVSFGLGFSSIIARIVIIRILTWWDDLLVNYDQGNIGRNTNIINNTNNMYYKSASLKKSFFDTFLIVGERKYPPRAEFFGRFNGQQIGAIGKYEERWLNTHEYKYWLRQKDRTTALENNLVDETTSKDIPIINTTTKISL